MKLNLLNVYKKDRPRLLLYLSWFATIENISKDKELNKKYPPSFSKDVCSLFTKRQLMMARSHEEFIQLPTPSTSTYFYCVKKDTESLSILRHIRNAIAHDNVDFNKKEKKYILVDYNKRGKKTANCKIEEDLFLNLIDLVLHRAKIENK